MLLMVDTGIKENVLESIRAVARRCGEHRPKSDVDLAVFGGDQVRFALDVEEEAPTLLSFDFVNMDGPVSQELEARVAQEGVVLYEEVR